MYKVIFKNTDYHTYKAYYFLDALNYAQEILDKNGVKSIIKKEDKIIAVLEV